MNVTSCFHFWVGSLFYSPDFVIITSLQNTVHRTNDVILFKSSGIWDNFQTSWNNTASAEIIILKFNTFLEVLRATAVGKVRFADFKCDQQQTTVRTQASC